MSHGLDSIDSIGLGLPEAPSLHVRPQLEAVRTTASMSLSPAKALDYVSLMPMRTAYSPGNGLGPGDIFTDVFGDRGAWRKIEDASDPIRSVGGGAT